MFHVPIRSRFANAILGVLGVVYFLSASATLIYYVVSNWGANSLIDRALQGALLGAAIAGLLFVAVAAGNLGFTRRPPSPTKSPTSPEHRTAAAAGS